MATLGPDPHRPAEPTAPVAPRAGEERKAGDRPELHAPVHAVLHPDQRADRRRADRAVGLAESLDLLGCDPAHLARALGRPLDDALGELGEAGRVPVDVVMVDEVVAHEHVHHPEGEGGIGARAQVHEPVGAVGGDRADGVDDDHRGAGRASLLDERPQVPVRHARVRAPEDDEPAVDQVHRIHAAAVAVRRGGPRLGGVATERAGLDRRADGVEEARRQRLDRQDALVAGAAPAEDGLTAASVDRLCHPGTDDGQRVVPRDPFEPTLALRADPDERVQDAVGAVDAVEEAVDLRAQLTPRVRMGRVATELDGNPVVDGRHPAARVGAVVVAGAEHGVGHGVILAPRGPTGGQGRG